MNARNVPSPLKGLHSRWVMPFILWRCLWTAVTFSKTCEWKDLNRGHWMRCKDCLKWCPNNEGGVRHNERCKATTKYGEVWVRVAALESAGAMALYECGADGEDDMVHILWHHFMALNDLVPVVNEWEDLAPFMKRLRRHGDEILVKWVAKWGKWMSAVRKFNLTDPLYVVAARLLEEGLVEAEAPPMMEVVAEGVEAGVQLPETGGVIPISSADDGLSLVEPEAAAERWLG